MLDADFWRWITAFIRGDGTSIAPPSLGCKRRNLLLIQYSGYNATGLSNASGELQAVAAVAKGFLPEFGSVTRVPGRAWMLFSCIPTRYKPAGDFDAMASDISIMELDLSFDGIEEISLVA